MKCLNVSELQLYFYLKKLSTESELLSIGCFQRLLLIAKIDRTSGKIDGHFTNHSLRATTASRGIEKRIPDKFVLERTGHRDVRSSQKYQRLNISTKINISRAFESNACLSNDCDEKVLTRKGEISVWKKIGPKRKSQKCLQRAKLLPKFLNIATSALLEPLQCNFQCVILCTTVYNK